MQAARAWWVPRVQQVLPYLNLFGMKCHDEAKEQAGGDADHAFNQEHVGGPLWEEAEVRIRLPY